MSDLAPVYNAIAAAEAELKSPLPTPKVGASVVWYDRADNRDGAEIAAIVTKVEGPGKVTLVALRPFGMAEHKKGCLHVSHKIHENRHNTVSKNAGSWDYLVGTKAPKEDFNLHVETINERIAVLKAQVAEAEAIKQKEKLVAAK